MFCGCVSNHGDMERGNTALKSREGGGERGVHTVCPLVARVLRAVKKAAAKEKREERLDFLRKWL